MIGMTVEEMVIFLENWLEINSLAMAEDVSNELGPQLQPNNQQMIKTVIQINQKLLIKWMPLFLVSLLATNNDSIEEQLGTASQSALK